MPSPLNENQFSKKEMELLWDEAIKSQNSECIRKTIKNGIIPRYLNATFIIQETNATCVKSLMDILLETNLAKEDTVYFDLADGLLKKGARLPNFFLERSAFSVASNYFAHLITCPHDLYIALRSNPQVGKARDEKGMTLLHHAAKVGAIENEALACLTHYLLFTMTRIDLIAQDKQGNTPLHIAAYCNEQNVMSAYYLSDFINKACNLGLNLFTRNKQGDSILNIIEQQFESLSMAWSQKENDYKKDSIKKRLEELVMLKERLKSITDFNNLGTGPIQYGTQVRYEEKQM